MTKLEGMPAGGHETWDSDIIYSESSCHINDLYYEGSEDEEYEDSATRIRRYERAGRQFLGGSSPFLFSVTLRGSLDSPLRCANPWIANRPEATTKQPTKPLRTNKKLHGIASLHNQPIRDSTLKPNECHLPSPESLKQAPYTRSHPSLEADGFDEVRKWRDDISFPPLKKDALGVIDKSENLLSPRKRRPYGVEWLKKTPVKKRRSDITHGRSRKEFEELDELMTDLPGSAGFGDSGQICSPSKRISPRNELRRIKGKNLAGSDDELSPNKAAAASLSSPVSLRHAPIASCTLENNEPYDTAALTGTQTTPSRSWNPKMCDTSYPENTNRQATSTIAPSNESASAPLLKITYGDQSSESRDGKPLCQATGICHLHDDTATLEDDQDTMSEDAETKYVPQPVKCKPEPMNSGEQSRLIQSNEATQLSYIRPQRDSFTKLDAWTDSGTNGVTSNQSTPNEIIVQRPINTLELKSTHDTESEIMKQRAVGTEQEISLKNGHVQEHVVDHSASVCEHASLSSTNMDREQNGKQMTEPPTSPTVLQALQASQVSPFNSAADSSSQIENKHADLPNTLAGDSQFSIMAASASAFLFEKEKDSVTSDQGKVNLAADARSHTSGTSAGAYSVNVHRHVGDADQCGRAREKAPPSAQKCPSEIYASMVDGTDNEDDKYLAHETKNPPNCPRDSHVSLSEQKPWATNGHALLARSPFQILSSNLLESKPLLRENEGKSSKGHMHSSCGSPDESAKHADPSLRFRNEMEDNPGFVRPTNPRAKTPEPRFYVKPFASFMSPSPNRSRRNRGLSASKLCSQNSRANLKSALRTQWSCRRSEVHVSWAISVETHEQPPESSHHGTSMTMSNSSRRQSSPPPDSQIGELPATHDTKFSKHFEAVAGRSDDSRQWPIATDAQDNGSSGPSAMAEGFLSTDTAVDEPKEAVQPNNEEDLEIPEVRCCDRRSEEPMDIVEDMFREMGDFWDPWNIDAELEQARKSAPTKSARPL